MKDTVEFHMAQMAQIIVANKKDPLIFIVTTFSN